jgi:hypothetical protein
MPCVYLPGPAPAVTVANKNDYAVLSSWLKLTALLLLFPGYHSFNNYDDIDFGNAVRIEHIYSPKVSSMWGPH